MKGRYVATGARTDCQNLVEEYVKINSVRYDAFAGVWRKMKFTFIYCCRKTYDELLEFSEELFRIAKEIWLTHPLFNGRIGALYMLYGLYYKQPTERLVKIRVTFDEFVAIRKFHDDVRAAGHLDANFCLSKLIHSGAFHFCATTYVHGLEKKFRKYFEKDRSLLERTDRPLPYVDLLHCPDMMRNTKESLIKYLETKCLLQGPHAKEPAQTLNYVNPSVLDTVKEKLKQISEPSPEVSCTGDQFTDDPSSSAPQQQPKGPWWLRPNSKKSHVGNGPDEIDSSSDEDVEHLSSEKLQETSRDLPVLED